MIKLVKDNFFSFPECSSQHFTNVSGEKFASYKENEFQALEWEYFSTLMIFKFHQIVTPNYNGNYGYNKS